MEHKTQRLTLTALMTALICIAAPISIPIPFSPVPASMTTFVIFLAVYILGTRQGTVSCIVYIIIGAIGLPVFSNFTGGVSKLFGPTGGYLFGYIFMALISGWFMKKGSYNKIFCLTGMSLGMAVCYLIGTLWLKYQMNADIKTAFISGVAPFIIGDMFKMILVVMIAPKIKKRVFNVLM